MVLNLDIVFLSNLLGTPLAIDTTFSKCPDFEKYEVFIYNSKVQ